MPLELFDRACNVIVGPIRVDGLRVVFDIKKTAKPEANTAKIEVWNLNEANRKGLEALTIVPCQVVAGYATKTSLLYSGFLRRVYSHVDGPNIVTTIESGDGEKQMRTARINRSYPKGTPVSQLVIDAALALQVLPGNVQEAIAQARLTGSGDVQLKAPAVLSGNAARELTALLDAMSLEWSIQDMALQIVRKGTPLAGTAVLVSPATGLLGSPSIDTEGKLRCETLIIPDVVPGRLMVMQSRLINGGFRIEECTYKGDTQGGDWSISIEAKKF